MLRPRALSVRRLAGRLLGQDNPPPDLRNAEVGEKLDAILAKLGALEARLTQLEQFSHGGRATFMGQGLVLVKVVVGGAQIACLVPADDRLISPWFIVSGAYETDLTDHFLRTLRRDDHCLDVGANFGYFTLLFGRFCPAGRIYGIEPDGRMFRIARDNVHINGFGGTTNMLHVAACEKRRAVTLHRRVGRPGNTSIATPSEEFLKHIGEKPSETFQIPGLPVDALLERMGGRVDVMKVDVEGAEPLVLAGASRLLVTNPGVQIVLEWSPGQMRAASFDPGEFLGGLAAKGLRFYTLGSRGAPGEPISQAELLNRESLAGILITAQPR